MKCNAINTGVYTAQTHTYIYICTYILHVYIYIYVCVYVCICTYISTHGAGAFFCLLYIHTHTYIYIYIYVHVGPQNKPHVGWLDLQFCSLIIQNNSFLDSTSADVNSNAELKWTLEEKNGYTQRHQKSLVFSGNPMNPIHGFRMWLEPPIILELNGIGSWGIEHWVMLWLFYQQVLLYI